MQTVKVHLLALLRDIHHNGSDIYSRLSIKIRKEYASVFSELFGTYQSLLQGHGLLFHISHLVMHVAVARCLRVCLCAVLTLLAHFNV